MPIPLVSRQPRLLMPVSMVQITTPCIDDSAGASPFLLKESNKSFLQLVRGLGTLPKDQSLSSSSSPWNLTSMTCSRCTCTLSFC